MYFIRTIQPQDNPHIAKIIREVSVEFALAAESGFAVADPILDQLYDVYTKPHSIYWVISNDQHEVFGGGGIAPLLGHENTLEIQKMYFMPSIRGLGFAKQILEKCIQFARDQGYTQIYLETTASLWQAVKLYEKLGFQHLQHPLGNTGHSDACEIRMLKVL